VYLARGFEPAFFINEEVWGVPASCNAEKSVHGLRNEDLHPASPAAKHNGLCSQDRSKAIGQACAAPRDRAEVVLLGHVQQMLREKEKGGGLESKTIFSR